MLKTQLLFIAFVLFNKTQAIGIYSNLNSKSDPICNSAGCTQYLAPERNSYPVNYFVPNFGLDRDIIDTHENINDAERNLNHKMLVREKVRNADVDYDYIRHGTSDSDLQE